MALILKCLRRVHQKTLTGEFMINTRNVGFTIIGSLLVIAFAPIVHAQAVQSVENLVCGESPATQVLDEDLNKVVGDVEKYEEVKLFQSFSKNDARKMKEGQAFVKIQFTERDENRTGWMLESEIKAKSACAGAEEALAKIANTGNAISIADLGKNISGLNDSKCCLFPLKHRPTASYTSGMRRFGAGRSGGRRIHAAADLYQTRNAPIVAVANGKAISGLYFFYQGTYAIEVKHSGGFVARYGEMTGKQASGVRSGATLSAGQQIGYMGKVNSGCCTPMLHFELYKGTQRGPLTTGGRGYQRRGDLLNPTSYLLKWEEKAL